MPDYILSVRAEIDLQEIWIYTMEHWSIEQADKYIYAIKQYIRNIAKNPLSGKSYDHITEGYKRFPANSHYVFYKILDNGIIEVIRILHQQMDIEERLKE